MKLTRSSLLFVFVIHIFIVAGFAAQAADPAGSICRILPLPDDQVAFLHNEKEVASWHFGANYPRPFFFPFLSAKGTRLTRMGHPGAPNHDHHRSIWFAHHKIAGTDFWGDQGKGRVRQKQWLAYEDGTTESIMGVRLGWLGADDNEMMEQDVVAAWRPGSGTGPELELQLTFRPVEDFLRLEKTNFGFLGVRMAKELSAHFGNGELRDSEGRQGEKAIFAQRARWVDYSGPTLNVPDGREGITFYDHPSNARYPSHWHVREDGWMGASFCLESGYTLKKSEPLVLRYLLLGHSGIAGPVQLEKIGKQFAERNGFELKKSRRPHREFDLGRKGKNTP